MKKVIVVLLAAALVLTVLTACSKKRGVGVSGDVPKKVIVGTMILTEPHAIALAENWLAEALGTEVEVVVFDAGRDVNVAMASGSIDFSIIGSTAGAVGIANGLPVKVVYIHSVLGENEALIVRGNLGVKNARDLVGRRIATTFSSTCHYSLMKYLETSNVNPSSIDIIDMRGSEVVAAFIRGDIDGAFTWDPHVTNMKNNGGVVIVTAKEVAALGHPTMAVEIVRTEFAERYPNLVSAYIRTMDRAVALYRSDPKAAGNAMARFTGLTAEECLAQVEGSVWLSVAEQKSMRWIGTSALGTSLYNTAMFLYEQGDLAQEPSQEVFQDSVVGHYLVSWEGSK